MSNPMSGPLRGVFAVHAVVGSLTGLGYLLATEQASRCQGAEASSL